MFNIDFLFIEKLDMKGLILEDFGHNSQPYQCHIDSFCMSYGIHCRLFWSPVGFDYPHYKDEGCFIRATLTSSSVPLPWIWLLCGEVGG